MEEKLEKVSDTKFRTAEAIFSKLVDIAIKHYNV